MPIVTLQLVADAAPDLPHGTVQQLADALGVLFDSPPGSTWVRLTHLPSAHYAENDTALDTNVHPVFVEVLKRTLDAPDVLATQANAIARLIADRLNRPSEHVHVLYLPPGAGRVAFGGQLVRE